MQGNAKIEIKFIVEEREYQFYFPQNAPVDEVLQVCNKLIEDLNVVKEKSSQESTEKVEEVNSKDN